jgi:hypothetical protein
MDKDAVDAHGENLYAKLLKFRIFLGDRRDFGRSDKGKIPGIETEDYKFALDKGKEER